MDQSFSMLAFGKSITSITFNDLQAYFSAPRNESDKLEFKSFQQAISGTGKDKDEIKKVLRTITAFLNSSGGIIIWGAPQGSIIPGEKEPSFQGSLTASNTLLEKDAFIATTANRIIPSPKGVLFHRIESEGKYIYIIEVPASEYAPHQFENVYYMRLDGQTAPAPHPYI